MAQKMSGSLNKLKSVLLTAALLALPAAAAQPQSTASKKPAVQLAFPYSDQSTEDLVDEARELAHQYKHKEADLMFAEAVRREPKDPHFHFLLARGLTEEGRFQKAIEELVECTFLDPKNERARFEIAQIYVYQGRFKDAVAVLEQIKKKNSPLSVDNQKAVEALNSIAAFYELGDPYSASYADPDSDMPWQKSDFPIKVAIWSDPEMTKLKAPFRQAVIDAFTRWRDASGGWLRFQIVDDQRQAKIVCKLVGVMRGNKHEGGGTKLGETLGDYDRKNADVRGFSRVEVFWDDESNPAHFRHVVIHEVGHALGLPHSNNTLDVMYPFVHPPYTEYPSKRDASSIKALYGIK